jgi:4-hydroxy-tetrahydrodipicolinate reductase
MNYRIGVMGCGGRMGQMLVREIAGTAGCAVAGGTESPGSDKIGRDVGEVAGLAALGIRIASDPAIVFDAADAVIDFTVPAASVAHARVAAARGKALVIGTTGMSAADEAAIAEAARRAPIVRAPNMSLAVNLLFALTEQVAARLGPEFDIEIFEIHHRHKIDAPSGTALALGHAAAAGRKVKLEDVWCKSRDGHTGARPTGEIGFAALRGGEEVGVHTVFFAAAGERLELSHRSFNRENYAAGAITGAKWLAGKKPGLYTMKDVLGL